MPYRYRCNACAAAGRRHGSRADAKTDRTDHRDQAHHGLAPEDEIFHEPGLIAIATRWLVTRLTDRR
ncbi:hypothetical protein KVH22_25300 [Streptomyces olivaceus]|uniref:hypothetical protein n=1 Tax=Streptomyces TaxID=1883 RepID=UPI001CC9BD59|nr:MULTISPECIES: hypothetical protein [Streptomyces]MBZ6258835.1 hypothetical protein [Streptomyces olivaceus]MCM8548923.1 hypothetical protein [Streptomyces sp. STCH 565 A]